MAKAIYGHVGIGPDRRLAGEVRRLTGRIAALEEECRRLRARNATLEAAADVASAVPDDLSHLDEDIDGGRLDGEGRLVVDGRLGDVIVTGGEKVWPRPVEDVIRGCPGVRDVAVIGRPDAEWGHRVVALVVPDQEGTPTLEALRAAVREALPPWAVPKELELVGALPTTALGKIRRSALH